MNRRESKKYPEWQFRGSPIGNQAQDYLGFVYIISSPSGMKYVGKKMLVAKIRRKPLKGTKRVRLDRKESDWRTYFGSSKELLVELAKTNPMDWTREILWLCTSKWSMAWLELKEQIEREVLLRGDFINGIVHVRLRRPNAETVVECGLRFLPPIRSRKKFCNG